MISRPFIVQAIVTHYLPATNTLPSRVKAQAYAKSLTISWDHALDVPQMHAKAAEALATKMKWSGVYFQGGMPADKGYCFVNCGHTCKDEAFHILKSVEG